MNTDKKIITIVGGGTAGWLSALYINKKYPNYLTKVIESSKIGIIGAGEGSTPNLKWLLVDFLGIDETEFLIAVNGTKKFGIDFTGWCSDTEHSFIHGFGIGGIESDGYSYHFNARLFADFLKSKAIERGVSHIDTEVDDFILNNGEIKELRLSDGETVYTDFIIDCTGFHRKIIGKIYHSEWESYSDQLIVNSAIPFFILNTKNDINQKTIAKAEEWGWVWNIPLQDRWGCGYIYNDEMVDDETIISKIQEKWGNHDIQINKKIKFNAGSYKEVWMGNTIAIGLSSGFLEPLEATSIMTVIIQLQNLPNDLFDYFNRERYNSIVNKVNLQNMLFIRHHYRCNREDTQFWKKYKESTLHQKLNDVYDKIDLNQKTPDEFYNILDWEHETKLPLIFSFNQYDLVTKNNYIKKRKTII
jgi:tryptophan halogenase